MTDGRLKVPVDLGDRRYDIVIGEGLLDDLPSLLRPFSSNGRIHVVTDETVFGLYKAAWISSEIDLSVTVLEPGEGQKSFSTLQKVLDDMFEQGLDRDDTLIAFGGGVIGDLTGLAASLFKRGCRFVQIPTTLLAQVDSSVGGKTAINVAQGKNLVGAFYQPQLVIADIDVLQTLPERELKAGYAEIVKYGLLGDAPFFNWLEANGQDVLALKPEAVAKAVATSCATKARIVAADERERGQRALLNLGHTFGHALEAESGYGSDLLHGEAVSAGMEMAFGYAAQQGLCREDDARRVSAHFATCELVGISDVRTWTGSSEALLSHMMQDKKNQQGELTLILPRAIGDSFVAKGVETKTVLKYLSSLN